MSETYKSPVPEEEAKEHKKKMTKAQLIAAMACMMALGTNLDESPYTDPRLYEEEE